MAIKISDNLLSFVFALGMFLFVMHNASFIPRSEGEAIIFLPQWGVLLMLGVAAFLFKENRLTLGEKKIWIPLIIISLFIVMQSILTWNEQSTTMICFSLCLLAFYSVGRVLGMKILVFIIPFVVIQSLSCLVYSMINAGEKTGGLLSETNYALGCGFVGVVGLACMNTLRKIDRVWLFIIIGIGMIFTGSAHLVLITLFVGIGMILRSDMSFEGLVALVLLVSILALWVTSTEGAEQYSRINQVSEDGASGDIDEWGRGRLPAYKEAIRNISFLGHGYNLYQTEMIDNEFINKPTVHNVPLLIIDQIGIIPALAWLWVTLYMLFKKTWKYAILAVLAVSSLDHFIWTVFSPYWWVLIGIISVSKVDDRLFRGDYEISYRESQTEALPSLQR